jgi:hypothetical protein
LGQPDQRAVAPGKHRGGKGHGPERVAHDITEQLSLLDQGGVPRSNGGLPCLTWVASMPAYATASAAREAARPLKPPPAV